MTRSTLCQPPQAEQQLPSFEFLGQHAWMTLYDPEHISSLSAPQILDSSALVLYFPAPNTATGEDVLEYHVHGGPAIVKAVLGAIPKLLPSAQSPAIPPPNSGIAKGSNGLHPPRFYRIRYAEPGEFTRRAFYNSRLDLTQIESLGDTLSAETEQQRRLAVKGSSGSSSLASRYEAWRQMLLAARGEMEALIDFSEDQHFDESPSTLVSAVRTQIEDLQMHLTAVINNGARGELLRNGISVALLGAPNAGKSSLLNRIVRREAAIVSTQAGTTRDVVEVNIDIGGFFCKFGDLAGLRGTFNSKRLSDGHSESVDDIEEEGIRRAKARVLEADVIVLVLSYEPSNTAALGYEIRLHEDILDTLQKCDFSTQRLVCVFNKMDQVSSEQSPRVSFDAGWTLDSVPRPVKVAIEHALPVCCKENAPSPSSANAAQASIQTLLHTLTTTFQEMTAAVEPDMEKSTDVEAGSYAGLWEESLGATERQRLLLEECQGHLDDFLASSSTPLDSTTNSVDRSESDSSVDLVLLAENLRAAGNCLAKITGRGESGDVEEVLGVVFSK
ncbi:mitochondrial splicing system protein [Agyrium rufum]|nr:mitochondrial splicing system protein [Agyrium rufum]